MYIPIHFSFILEYYIWKRGRGIVGTPISIPTPNEDMDLECGIKDFFFIFNMKTCMYRKTLNFNFTNIKLKILQTINTCIDCIKIVNRFFTKFKYIHEKSSRKKIARVIFEVLIDKPRRKNYARG